MRRLSRTQREEGSASVIGTLLAISILLSLVSIVVTGFVPRWGEDKEATHMKEVYTEMARMKSNIDQQILDAKNSNGPSIVMYSPMSLGMQTVPIFTANSRGSLSLNERLSSWTASNASQPSTVASTGSFHFVSNNLYFEDLQYIYENGGVIVFQDDFAIVKIGPQFNAYIQNGELNIDYTLISLLGDSDTIGGSDTVGVQTQCTFYGSESHDYTTPTDTTFDITSDFVDAWMSYFSITLQNMGLEKGATGDFTLTKLTDTTMQLEFNDVDHLRLGFAAVKARLE